ncbi:MAG: Maf family protein [Paracoccaceae bacterium]|nr:Maf family protein [Paracoccaceae bacterium]
MKNRLILASGSEIRAEMLHRAGVEFEVMSPMVDEASIKESLMAEGAKPHDIADALAEYKSRKVSMKKPDAFVIGADQILACDGVVYDKAENQDALIQQLKTLRGQVHRLYTAAVIYQGGEPQWRFVKQAKLTMRNFSDQYLLQYVERNWPEISYCVGGYQLENEGARLFHRVEGDYFTVLGLPLIEVLGYLTERGILEQ